MFHQRIAERFKRRPSTPKKLRPQLEMVRLNLEDLPEIVVPEGYALRTYLPGDEIAWCKIMEGNVGRNWTEEKWKTLILQDARFDPENLFLATHRGEPVASGCAWRLGTGDPEVGVFHMIATLEAHRGKGLGHLLNAAILHRLRDPPVPKGTPLHRRLSHPRDQGLSESGVCSVLHAPESSEEMEAHSAAAGDFGAVYRARMSSGPGRSRQRPFPCSEYGISQAPASHSTRPKRCRLLAMSA